MALGLLGLCLSSSQAAEAICLLDKHERTNVGRSAKERNLHQEGKKSFSLFSFLFLTEKLLKA